MAGRPWNSAHDGKRKAIFQLGRTYVLLNKPALAVELNRRMLQDAEFPLGHWPWDCHFWKISSLMKRKKKSEGPSSLDFS